MASRTRPEMVGFRVTREEKAAIEALARFEDLNVAQVLHHRVLPWAREELARRLMRREIGDEA